MKRTVLTWVLLSASSLAAQEKAPAKVRFLDPRTEGTPVQAPVDPAVRINLQYANQMIFGLMVPPNKMLSTGASLRTHFRIDDRIIMPNVAIRQALPPGPGGVARDGVLVPWMHDNLAITQTIEVVPSQTRGADGRRQRDAVMVKYHVENKGDAERKVGVRMRMDAMCGHNDGALFAAPTFPDRILDGVELKGDKLPDYVQILERPDLKNPGMVGHFALKMRGGLIGPDRFLCTWHAANDMGWEVQVRQAQGDSDAVIYWEPRSIPAKGSATFAFGYGVGLAMMPEAIGRVRVNLTGSFEPGETFAIEAMVEDPAPGQSLTLELPPGMTRLAGREIQPVSAASETAVASLVRWRGRVTKPGEYPIRIRSSTGVTITRTVVVEAN
jgi:hypothetical protein